jgi:hypothetical protein
MLLRACRAALLLRPQGLLFTTPWARPIHATTPAWAKLKPVQQLRDEAIRTKFIRVVEGDDAAKLGPVTMRSHVLDSIDRSKNWLMLGECLSSAGRT